MKKAALSLLLSAVSLAACTGGTGSSVAPAPSADAIVLGTLAAVGATCTPALPPPALAACTGKAAGDACTVTREGQTVSATCASDDGVLMCGADEDAHGLPPALTDPCTGKAAGDACSVAGLEHHFAGVCTAALAGSLACLPPPPPPPPPVTACDGKMTGAACSFGVPGALQTGTCYAVGERAIEVCLPAPPPEPPRLAACDGKASGAACTVTHEGRTRTGTCQPPAMGSGALACDLAPPAPPAVTVSACTAHAAGDACSFTWEDGRAVNGTCRMAGDGTLVCAPACPP